MKTAILLCLLSIAYVNGMAMDVKGRVIDEENNPIEFASVSCFANDSIVGGGVTDINGKFSLSLNEKCDKIRISSVGYDEAVVTPEVGDLGNIILKKTGTTLKEVVVKAPLISREADRIIMNVAANPFSANKDAQELLKTAPGVWATDNSLSIYGQSGTTVYIDDTKVRMSGMQLMTYLKSIQSSAISTIEIIPRAGAEYSASSSGGIIKINLKRNRVDGLTGSAGLSNTIGEYTTWINPFANISLHSGKWTVNLSGNLNGSPKYKSTTYEEAENANAGISLSGISHHKETALQGNVMLGVFYNPTAKDKIGIQFDYNPSSTYTKANSQTTLSSRLSDELTMGSYRSDYLNHNLNLTLNYTHTLDKKGSNLKWNSNYHYQNSSTDEKNRMAWQPADRDSIYSTDNSNRYNIFTTELSIQKNFKKDLRLNVGVKYTHNDVGFDSRHLNFQDDEWISNYLYDYSNKYLEDVAAGYATLNAKTGRWKFKAGLRGEYYHTSGVGVKRSEFGLFPSANVAFNLTKRGDYTVALGYNRKIHRPSFWSLNPTVRQYSDYFYSVGNPDLRPSYKESVSLDFVLAGKFTIAASYSQTDNAIRQMYTSNPDYPERLYLTWGNVGKDRSGYIHGDGNLNITKWWNLYASLTYVVTSQKLDVESGYDTFGYVQAVGSMNFQLPYSFSISVNGFYNSKMKIGNITVYPFLTITPTIQKQFGKHWSVSLGMDNIMQREGKTRTTSAGFDRVGRGTSYPAVKLGVTYNFNSGKGFRTPRIINNSDSQRLQQE